MTVSLHSCMYRAVNVVICKYLIKYLIIFETCVFTSLQLSLNPVPSIEIKANVHGNLPEEKN